MEQELLRQCEFFKSVQILSKVREAFNSTVSCLEYVLLYFVRQIDLQKYSSCETTVKLSAITENLISGEEK